MNFDELRRTNTPFTAATPQQWGEYLAWAKSAPCATCGTTKDQTPAGEWWATETECGPCFRARCERINAR